MNAAPSFGFQNAALTAQRFADQKRSRVRVEQTGRVKLDELEIGDGGAGTTGHGHAVTRGDVRIGGVQVHFASAARRQHRDRRDHETHFLRAPIQRVRAEAAIVT